MIAGYRLLLMLCGFAAIFAFVILQLVPAVMQVRSSQLDLFILETRARIAVVADEPADDSSLHLQVLCNEDFFIALAHIRASASALGLEVSELSASEVDSIGSDVSETSVKVSLTGDAQYAIDYLRYLTGGVYNVWRISLSKQESASLDVWLSIFHEQY